MADLVITAPSVVQGSGAVVPPPLIAGEAITQGQPVYQLNSDKKVYKAKSDTTAHAAAVGISLVSVSAGQPCSFQSAGTITIGATTVAGRAYYVSNTAGGVQPVADLATTYITTILGHGDGAGGIALGINATTIIHA